MTILRRTCCTAFFVAFLQVGGAIAQSPTGIVAGTVSLPSPDGQPVMVPGVTLSLTCAGVEPRIEVSSETGQFRFADAPVGDCSIVAELQGFKSAVKAVAVRPGETADVALRLDVDALHEEVTVNGSQDTIDLPIDAVREVQVRGAAFAPEFGLSAGAVTTVETQRAGDAWHITVN